MLMPLGVNDEKVIRALAVGLLDQDAMVRLYCAQGLKQLGTSAVQAAPQLREALLDASAQVRTEAFFALEYMNEDVLSLLENRMQDQDARIRILAASVLMMAKKVDGSLPILVAGLKEKNVELRIQAANTLAVVGQNHDEIFGCLVEGLKSKTECLRHQSLFSLMLLGSRAAETAPQLLDMMQNDPVQSVRHAAGTDVAQCRCGSKGGYPDS